MESMKNRYFLGIDPGSHKVGLAIVDSQKKMVYKNIINPVNIVDTINSIIEEYDIEDIGIGNTGNCKKLISYLNLIKVYRANQKKKLNIHIVDERNSTLEARKIFVQKEKNPLKKLFTYVCSIFLPLDDYAAFVIACRLVSKLENVSRQKQNL